MEVFGFIQTDDPAAKKANSREADLPPSWLFPLRAPNHTLCDEYQLVKLSMRPFNEQRGPEGQVGKVWQSNAVLLTGNIRQWRPLQINVQQVSRLAGRSLLDE